MLLMAELAWKSRHIAGRPPSFPSLIAGFAILHYALFLIAGTFSGQLVEAGPGVVLLRNPGCGVWDPTYYRDYVSGIGFNDTSLDASSISQQLFNKIYGDVDFSLQYAQQCYTSLQADFSSSICSALPKRELLFNHSVQHAACPFGDRMCHEDSETIAFDTGFINSHYDLGVNAPAIERVDYRRLTTCAVLNDTGRIVDTERPSDISGEGPRRTTSAHYGENFYLNNMTYSISDMKPYWTNSTASSSIVPYQLDTEIAAGKALNEFSSTFDPILELRPVDNDLNLFFLSFQGSYFSPVDDPWFAAHTPAYFGSASPEYRNRFVRDRNISTLACKEQHQLCTHGHGCSPLLGYYQLKEQISGFAPKSLTPIQKVTISRMLLALDAASMSQITVALAQLRNPILASKRAITERVVASLSIPKDQWQIELNWWHSIAMAMFQRRMMLWATGGISPKPKYIIPPQSKADEWFCNNVMVPSARHLSFNVLAMAMIILVGSMVILVSWHVEKITGYIQLRYQRGIELRKVWDEDDMLNLRSCVNRCSWRPPLPLKDKKYSSSEYVSWEKAPSIA